LNILITGYSSFISKHIQAYFRGKIGFTMTGITRDEYYQTGLLEWYLENSDVVLHLAGVSRSSSEELVFSQNQKINMRLYDALIKSNSKVSLIFASSTHISRKTGYGKAKKYAGNLFLEWAKKDSHVAINLILPNLFGPYAKIGHTSVVANFCSALAIGQEPIIIKNTKISLLFAPKIAPIIEQVILKPSTGNLTIPGKKIFVTELLEKIRSIATDYEKSTIIPESDSFDGELLITYLYYR
jgi:UDP-2-acetamido-2,6-beta-L-arabino-hexul-4-ose reductase